MTPALDAPNYPLSDALASGVPFDVAEDARRSRRLYLTRLGAEPVRLLWESWPRGPGGTWYAKRSWRSRTLTGYAGGHRPRGGGVPGLSADGIRRALAGLDRQQARWQSGEARRRVYRPCPSCGRPLPLADPSG